MAVSMSVTMAVIMAVITGAVVVVMLRMVAVFVVIAQRIGAEIVARVPPDGVHVVGTSLGVVVFGEQRGPLHPVVVALTGFETTGPCEPQRPEALIGRVFRRLGIGEFIWDASDIHIEQRAQDLALVTAQHRRGEAARLLGE